MKQLGNILWHFPFLGFLSAFMTYFFGAILTATVIAAPIGLGLLQYGKFLLAPFSRAMIRKDQLEQQQNSAWATYSTFVKICYFPCGVIMALVAVIQVGVLFLTIVGIPVAIVIAKSLGTFLNPVNKVCVPIAVADELDRRSAQSIVAERLAKSE